MSSVDWLLLGFIWLATAALVVGALWFFQSRRPR